MCKNRLKSASKNDWRNDIAHWSPCGILNNGRNITVRLRYFSLDLLSLARTFPVTCKKGERQKHKKGQSYHTITSAIHACTLYRLTHRRHLNPGDYLIHAIRLEWRHVSLQNWLCACVWLVCICAYSCASSRAYSCVCIHVEACVNCSSAVATCLHILDEIALFQPALSRWCSSTGTISVSEATHQCHNQHWK